MQNDKRERMRGWFSKGCGGTVGFSNVLRCEIENYAVKAVCNVL